MKTGGNKGRFFSPNIDFIIVYAKNIQLTVDFKEALDPKIIEQLYTKIETSGPRKGERYRPFGLYQSSLDSRPNQRYYIQCPDGSLCIPPGNTFPSQCKDGEKVLPEKTDGCWRWSVERYNYEKKKGSLVFVESNNGVLLDSEKKKSKWNVYSKIWLSDREEEGQTPTNFIQQFENRHSAKELKDLGLEFDFAKPVGLIKYLLGILGKTPNRIILDFFSGSATTAHAVMQLNAEDGGHRKFIMVQIPEECEEGSEAAKAGYNNICEIGEERIRRAGKNIKTSLRNEIENAHKRIEAIDKQLDELETKAKEKSKEGQIPGLEGDNLNKKEQEKKQALLQEKEELSSKIEEKTSILEKLDIGFRVLKLDSSNMEDVYYRPSELKQENLPGLADNVKADRTAEDLLFQVMLEKDIPLSSRIETETVAGMTIFNVADGYLLACFDTGVTDEVVTAIAKKQPVHAVFRDAGMATDSTAINFEQIFATYSPDTKRSIL